MRPTSAGTRRWRAWLAPAITPGLGVILGGIQLLLLFALLSPLSLPLIVVLSAGGYFGFSLVAGIRSSLRGEDTVSGVGAGCLVGTISVLTLAIPAAVFAMVQLATPHADCLPPSCRSIINPAHLGSAVALLVGLIVLAEAFWALVACALGGWIGGMLGERMAS